MQNETVDRFQLRISGTGKIVDALAFRTESHGNSEKEALLLSSAFLFSIPRSVFLPSVIPYSISLTLSLSTSIHIDHMRYKKKRVREREQGRKEQKERNKTSGETHIETRMRSEDMEEEEEKRKAEKDREIVNVHKKVSSGTIGSFGDSLFKRTSSFFSRSR